MPRRIHRDPMRSEAEANRMVEDNFGLAKKFAKQQSGRIADRDELLSLAMSGLMHASRNYDPNRGAFSTCAFAYMRMEVWHHIQDRMRLAERMPMVHVPMGNIESGRRSHADVLCERELARKCVVNGAASLTVRERRMLMGAAAGRKLRELSDGCSTQRVQQVVATARRKFIAACGPTLAGV